MTRIYCVLNCNISDDAGHYISRDTLSEAINYVRLSLCIAHDARFLISGSQEIIAIVTKGGVEWCSAIAGFMLRDEQNHRDTVNAQIAHHTMSQE